jgi:hypothetical protein
MNIPLALAHIDRLKDILRDAPDEDERLWLDALEGETDVFEIVRALLNAIEEDEGHHAALTGQMADRKERRDRCEIRIERRKAAVAMIMKAARLSTLPLAEATVSLRILPAKIAVNDPAAVPEEYTKPSPRPDMDAIKNAFKPGDALPNWLRIDPERPSLTIRRK